MKKMVLFILILASLLFQCAEEDKVKTAEAEKDDDYVIDIDKLMVTEDIILTDKKIKLPGFFKIKVGNDYTIYNDLVNNHIFYIEKKEDGYYWHYGSLDNSDFYIQHTGTKPFHAEEINLSTENIVINDSFQILKDHTFEFELNFTEKKAEGSFSVHDLYNTPSKNKLSLSQMDKEYNLKPFKIIDFTGIYKININSNNPPNGSYVIIEKSNNRYKMSLANADAKKLVIEIYPHSIYKTKNNFIEHELNYDPEENGFFKLFMDLVHTGYTFEGLISHVSRIAGSNDYAILTPLSEDEIKEFEIIFDEKIYYFSNGLNALIKAAKGKNLDEVKRLLEMGLNVNSITHDEIQLTALYYAVKKRDMDIADFLIKAGADINLGFDFPLNAAVMNNDDKMVEYLIKMGANVNELAGIYGVGRHSLKSAIEKQNLTIIKMLVAAGIDLNIKFRTEDLEELSPVEYAEKFDNQEIVDYLKSLEN